MNPDFTERDALVLSVAIFGALFGLFGGCLGGIVFGLWLARVLGVEL